MYKILLFTLRKFILINFLISLNNFQQNLMIKYNKEIKLFHNPFLVDINHVKNNLQMEVIKIICIT